MNKLIFAFLIALPHLALATQYADFKEVEYQYAEENRVNPHFQNFLSQCGEGLIPFLKEADKIEFLNNGKKIYLSSVVTEWQAAPGTFGELGGEVEVSSKVERVITLKNNGKCVTKKVNYPFTMSKKTRASLADKGLMTCAKTALEVSEKGLTIGQLGERLVKEYPEVPVTNGSVDSTQRQDFLHHYEVLNAQGRIVGLIQHRFRYDLEIFQYGHVEVDISQTEMGCSYIDL